MTWHSLAATCTPTHSAHGVADRVSELVCALALGCREVVALCWLAVVGLQYFGVVVVGRYDLRAKGQRTAGCADRNKASAGGIRLSFMTARGCWCGNSERAEDGPEPSVVVESVALTAPTVPCRSRRCPGDRAVSA